MSFIGAAVGGLLGGAAGSALIGTAIGAIAGKTVSDQKKAAKAFEAQARKSAAAQTAAIREQTAAMKAQAIAPPPPPPPAPVSAPIRQAAPGTGSQVLSPAMLIRRAGRRTTSRTNQGQSLGYGSRL
jgi:type IV secretory pathway VirB10-like protein